MNIDQHGPASTERRPPGALRAEVIRRAYRSSLVSDRRSRREPDECRACSSAVGRPRLHCALLSVVAFVVLLPGSGRAVTWADLGDYFTCVEWIDRNQDGVCSPDEFTDVKTEFRPSDVTVTFVARVERKQGLSLETRVYSPSGSLYRTHLANLTSETVVSRSSEDIAAMIAFGGAGDWSYRFYIGDDCIHAGRFRLISYSAIGQPPRQEPNVPAPAPPAKSKRSGCLNPRFIAGAVLLTTVLILLAMANSR